MNSQLLNQVFMDLAHELEAQGVSRKVSADMFGMALRAYQRKLRRLTEAQSDPGSTLWNAVLQFIQEQPVVTRAELLARFARDEERQLLSVAKDLVDTNLVFRSGSGVSTAYRAATDAEWGHLSRQAKDDGLAEWLWVLIYREGPLSTPQLSERLGRDSEHLTVPLQRLQHEGRVQLSPGGLWSAEGFVLPLGSSRGWEAAVFDHLQAVVQTICQRLQLASSDATDKESADTEAVGGSTYGFDVWPTHPLRAEVVGLLSEFRTRCGQLRTRVDEYNRQHPAPETTTHVIAYAGQCLIQREALERLEADEPLDLESQEP